MNANLSGNKGKLYIISAPSGAGKTTLCNAVRQRYPDIRYSISHTTRKPRPGEEHGKDYFFISQAEFKKGIEEGKWAEWAQVHGNFYGTSSEFINDQLARGHSILLDIDVQGAMQIVEKFPDAVTIFIAPPSMEALAQRIKGRGDSDPDDIALRLTNAKTEMTYQNRYRHVIVNDQLSDAVEQILALIASYENTTN